jgi:hypothetical protein
VTDIAGQSAIMRHAGEYDEVYKVKSSICGLVAGLFLISFSAPNPAIAQQNQARAKDVDVVVGGGSPLSAVTTNSGSANCAQGKIVVGNDGTVGFLVPVMGPNVLRGSSDQGNTVTWAVVPIDQVDQSLVNAFTTCRTAQ